MTVTCATCGFTYVPELAEDRAQHRHAHYQLIRAISPKPTKRFLHAIRNGLDGEHVSYKAARWKNEEMYARARMFRREFKYDFSAWDITGNDPAAHGFLFNDDTGIFGHGSIAGACAIRWTEFSDAPAQWAMIWAWIAPAVRRKGILSRRWPLLKQRFGEFHLSRPLSDAMTGFVNKHSN
jgi:hypothetical protein